MSSYQELLLAALQNPENGWSVGTFGAVGEFMWDPVEPCQWSSHKGCLQIVTGRGGIRVTPCPGVTLLAYNTFPGGGDTWGNEIAFCLPARRDSPPRAIRCLGPDAEALRSEDREGLLFDIGVGIGDVRFCLRTQNPELIDALREAEGADPLGPRAAASHALAVKLSPPRIAISPLARIEVYAPIPPPGGQSPLGPHTHLLPRLVASRRTHSANAPVPAGLQPVLMMHPPSPWRDSAGRPIPYDAGRAGRFDAWMAQFGLLEYQRLRAQLEAAVLRKEPPEDFPAPRTRHERTQLRILLRRLSQEVGAEALRPWRERYDAGSLGGPHEVDVETA